MFQPDQALQPVQHFETCTSPTTRHPQRISGVSRATRGVSNELLYDMVAIIVDDSGSADGYSWYLRDEKIEKVPRDDDPVRWGNHYIVSDAPITITLTNETTLTRTATKLSKTRKGLHDQRCDHNYKIIFFRPDIDNIAGTHLDSSYISNPRRPPHELLDWHFRQAVGPHQRERDGGAVFRERFSARVGYAGPDTERAEGGGEDGV
ncbi:hypothetical protein VTN00DRAFT_871 [Thermoascus crustaceus]|uniref:uncharacterized protein n=1 Tax=Thermoascus crustaceus TaxID=5088 RepID=UPI003741EA81